MLTACPECNGQVSDQADKCPHCGHPTGHVAPVAPPASKAAAPVFLVFALAAFVVLLFTPRFLIGVPLLATLGGAAVSLVRREKGRLGAVLLLLATGFVFWTLERPSTSVSSATPSR